MNPANTVRFILIQQASGKPVNVQPQRTLNWKYKKQRKKSIRSKLPKEQVKNDNNSASFCSGEDIKFLQVIFRKIKKPAISIAGFFS
jgi:ribosomal protein L14E/L6E/L27E